MEELYKNHFAKLINNDGENAKLLEDADDALKDLFAKAVSGSLHICIIQQTTHPTRYTGIWLLFIRFWNSNKCDYECRQHGVLFLLWKLFISRDNRLYWCTCTQWLLQDDGPKSAIVCIHISFQISTKQLFYDWFILFSFKCYNIQDPFLCFLSSIDWRVNMFLWIIACVRTLT